MSKARAAFGSGWVNPFPGKLRRFPGETRKERQQWMRSDTGTAIRSLSLDHREEVRFALASILLLFFTTGGVKLPPAVEGYLW